MPGYLTLVDSVFQDDQEGSLPPQGLHKEVLGISHASEGDMHRVDDQESEALPQASPSTSTLPGIEVPTFLCEPGYMQAFRGPSGLCIYYLLTT
jgi:hypothetical protein